jgi:hypothetical protein
VGKSFVSRARDLGREHGENAAAWWLQEMPVGGRSSTGDSESREWAVSMLAKIADCDADIPQSDMSGEWADGMTPNRLADEIGYDAENDKREEWGFLCSDLCDAYEQGFAEACERAIVKSLKLHAQASR